MSTTGSDRISHVLTSLANKTVPPTPSVKIVFIATPSATTSTVASMPNNMTIRTWNRTPGPGYGIWSIWKGVSYPLRYVSLWEPLADSIRSLINQWKHFTNRRNPNMMANGISNSSRKMVKARRDSVTNIHVWSYSRYGKASAVTPPEMPRKRTSTSRGCSCPKKIFCNILPLTRANTTQKLARNWTIGVRLG